MAARVVFSTWSLADMLNSRLELIEVSSEQLILGMASPDSSQTGFYLSKFWSVDSEHGCTCSLLNLEPGGLAEQQAGTHWSEFWTADSEHRCTWQAETQWRSSRIHLHWWLTKIKEQLSDKNVFKRDSLTRLRRGFDGLRTFNVSTEGFYSFFIMLYIYFAWTSIRSVLFWEF